LQTRAGYVAIVGLPNAGKSTLMNKLIGENLSIVTDKPQTTRKRVLGIHTCENVQIVFIDTPGALKPRYELQRKMMEYFRNSLAEADAICLLIEAQKFDLNEIAEGGLLEELKMTKKPIVAVLNKIDLLADVKQTLPMIDGLSKLGAFSDIVPVSALKEASLERLIGIFEKYMPESEFYYDSEYISAQPEKFFVSEIIREYVFKQFREEIPYSTEVTVRQFKERHKGKWYIAADIVLERQSQKVIVVGANGESVKRIGEAARQDIEKFLSAEVYLDLFVKVRPKWRYNKNMLKNFGY
jgi:GTP-binding protein Era